MVMKNLSLIFEGPGGRFEKETSLDEVVADGLKRADVIQDHKLKDCREYVTPLEHNGLTLHQHTIWYQSLDGHSFVETRLANDSMFDPIGYLKGHFLMSVDGVPIVHTNKLREGGEYIELFDQGSFAKIIGEPFWAPHERRSKGPLAPYLKLMGERVGKEALQAARGAWSRLDPRGEDHWDETHRTGSPGARYSAEFPVNFLLGGSPWPMLHWMLEQYGTSFKGEEGHEVFVPGRPHHLYNYNSTFASTFSRQINDTEDNPTLFGEGAIKLRRGRNWPIGHGCNTWGRDQLPMHNYTDGRDDDEWLGKRINGFPGWAPSRVTFRGRNGGDMEHFYRHVPLYWASLLTPSVFAKNALRSLLEMFTTPPGEGRNGVDVHGWDHSDRTLGWAIHAYSSGGYALENSHFWDLARKMRDKANARKSEGLVPAWYPDEVGVFSRERQRAFWDSSDNAYTQFACWQSAVIAEACMHAADLDPRGNAEATHWGNLAGNAIAVADKCWVQGTGLYENLQANRDGTMEPGKTGNKADWMGTSHWCGNPGGRLGRPWAQEMWEYWTNRGDWRKWHDGNNVMWRWHFEQRFQQENAE